MDTNDKSPIDRAADALGGISNLASALGVSVQAVHKYKLAGTPAKRCVQIEHLTDRKITRKDLRPDDWRDIWPELKDDRKGDRRTNRRGSK